MFDAYSKEGMIKPVENNFHGIETLINSTLQVVGFDELVDKELAEKKDFFEQVIVNSEKIFFVLDNLENLNSIHKCNFMIFEKYLIRCSITQCLSRAIV